MTSEPSQLHFLKYIVTVIIKTISHTTLTLLVFFVFGQNEDKCVLVL